MLRNLRSIIFLLILAGLAFAQMGGTTKGHAILGPLVFGLLLGGFILLLVLNWAQGAGIWPKKK